METRYIQRTVRHGADGEAVEIDSAYAFDRLPDILEGEFNATMLRFTSGISDDSADYNVKGVTVRIERKGNTTRILPLGKDAASVVTEIGKKLSDAS